MSTTIIVAIITLVGSILTSSGFLYLRENRESISVKTLSETIGQLEKDRDTMRMRIDALENALRISVSEKIEIESYANVCKRAFNYGITCSIDRDECPIVIKFKELNKQLGK